MRTDGRRETTMTVHTRASVPPLPDLVGQNPLLDMRRFHLLLAGASWTAEFGDPDDPADWEFIEDYSPYHNISADRAYPPVLITKSTNDDRVHPGHAREMAAALEAAGHQVLYNENTEGGHEFLLQALFPSTTEHST
jgi:prolyl oligopeptidase